jgi:hypothetical protein
MKKVRLLGIGHWALGRQCVARVPRVEAPAVIGNNSFPFPFPLSRQVLHLVRHQDRTASPFPLFKFPLPTLLARI